MLSDQRLSAFFFVPWRFESVVQRPICGLTDLLNPFNNVFEFPFVYRHPEGRPPARVLADRDRQIAADVCLRF
jgi:hypothetical protein